MKRRSPIDAGFDRWLDRQLHDIYDPVLNEAVPDEIERLLKEFDHKPAEDGGEGAGGGG